MSELAFHRGRGGRLRAWAHGRRGNYYCHDTGAGLELRVTTAGLHAARAPEPVESLPAFRERVERLDQRGKPFEPRSSR